METYLLLLWIFSSIKCLNGSKNYVSIKTYSYIKRNYFYYKCYGEIYNSINYNGEYS